MLGVTVKGGTGAGRRIVKPRPADWPHICNGTPVTLAGYWTACPVCKEKRP